METPMRCVAVLGSVALVFATGAPTTLQTDVDNLRTAGAVSVVAQVNNHGTVTNAVAGAAQQGTTTAVDPNTHYRTGSVTKTFVSATILQLVGEGKLSMDDTVDHWLPGLITGNGNDGTKITVRELLNHTSGLFDYTNDSHILPMITTANGFYANRYNTYTPQQLIGFALAHPSSFAPGASYSYSNTNYIVAGQIIQAVTGNTWDVEVTNRIIKPLGLTNTSIPAGGTATIPAPFADGYNLWSSGVYSDTTSDNMTWGGAAGKIITDTHDEVVFYSALLSGKVLKPAQLTQMQTTVQLSHSTSYGLGIGHVKLCNTDVWTHTGGVIGYETIVATTSDGSTTLAVDLATTDVTSADPTFDAHVSGATDALVNHVFCGANYTGTDSITAQESAWQGKPATP